MSSVIVHTVYGRWTVASVLPFTWFTLVAGYRAYDRRVIGRGGEELRRLVRAALALPALAAAGYWLFAFDAELLHDVIAGAVPVLALALLGRALLRRRLRLRWARGLDREAALLVGSAQDAVAFVNALGRGRARELEIAGVCLTDPVHAPLLQELDIPVLGGIGDVAGAVHSSGSGAVVVLPEPGIDAAVLRRLSWSAAAEDADFLVAPTLSDVAANRLRFREGGGMPLLHIRSARLGRLPRLPKEIAERTAAAVALVLLLPVLVLIALAVRLDSSGPALFRQRRVGCYGTGFTMLKFRTMREDAEALREELEHLNQNSDGLLFKVRQDPRVTRVGALLRRTSLDELPQLINVLKGDMALVGPRPPLPEEVEGYSHEIKRRLLVKPGLTGLWQVSGRSDLPWEEAVRLDLAYVDNWSLGMDADILLRTVPAVLRGTGAY
ncbi:sugar transferase [Streptacidiphilus monticola]|uniref:Sugar transferase n=1 Tax=Streptacidiphilus monticola TaxID=2161674 RepID=A0ABW1GCM9_9ACTN